MKAIAILLTSTIMSLGAFAVEKPLYCAVTTDKQNNGSFSDVILQGTFESSAILYVKADGVAGQLDLQNTSPETYQSLNGAFAAVVSLVDGSISILYGIFDTAVMGENKDLIQFEAFTNSLGSPKAVLASMNRKIALYCQTMTADSAGPVQ